MDQNLDRLARLGKSGSVDRDFIDRISQVSALGFFRFLIVVNEDRIDTLAGLDEDLAEGICHIRLNSRLLDEALSPAAADGKIGQPGLAIERVDAAIARARQRKRADLRLDDFEYGAATMAAPTADELKSRLRAHVRGQDSAISVVAERLAPALAGLKLRPERPHNVFFFAGPSGVGKTETAKRLAEAVYGSPEVLIRLDMSEHADEDYARMKLIVASKIWKNSSTDGLLTTKVLEKPRSVILLDKFEKSDPSAWNVFLQVFDEGKLTDGCDHVASFSDTIVILTSNLGAREGGARSAGHGEAGEFDTSRQDAATSDALPPELQGRLTATVHFDPLAADALRELARMELERVFARFGQQGWQIEFDDDVVDWVAHAGYDSRFGARHVQRVIETEIFPLIATSNSRHVQLAADQQGAKLTMAHTSYSPESHADSALLDL